MVYGVWAAGWRKWDDVGCFAKGVLGGVCATYLDVELVAAVAAADDDRFAEVLTKGFEDGLAELAQGRDVLRRAAVVDVQPVGCGTSLEFGEDKMF